MNATDTLQFRTSLEALEARLFNLGTGVEEPYNYMEGICDEIYHWKVEYCKRMSIQVHVESNNLYHKIRDWMTEWPPYSGSFNYPVPYVGPREGLLPVQAYHFIDNLWEDEYGDMRKDLCCYLAHKIRTEYNLLT